MTNTIKITEPNTLITSASGTHASGKNNLMVEEIHFQDEKSQIYFFPKGLERIFPHLKSIRIWSVELKEIYQGDLQPFLELELFHPTGNKLEFLEKDLFKFNPKLKTFAPGSCPVTYIDPNIFDHLTNLTSLFIESCVREKAEDDQSEVLRIIQEIKQKCSKPADLAKFQNLFSREEVDLGTTELMETTEADELSRLKEIFEIKTKILTDQLEVLENSIKNDAKRDECKMRTEELQVKITKLEVDLSHQNIANESRLSDALSTKNILIFVVFPLIALVTVLNIFLIIACFRKRLNLSFRSRESSE